MPRRFLTFTVPGLALRLPGSVMDYWVEARSPAPGLPGYSAVHRWNDAMRFTFTLARSEVFLPTLDRADWAAYLAHLSQAPGRLLLADDDSATNPHMLTLLGARTRFLAYWDPARDGGADQLTWQTVLQHCGYTVVLTMTAPYSTLVEIPALYEALVMGLEEAAGR